MIDLKGFPRKINKLKSLQYHESKQEVPIRLKVGWKPPTIFLRTDLQRVTAMHRRKPTKAPTLDDYAEEQSVYDDDE